ncbi:hypothetical protein KC640_01655 [Candidatus Dojkabacteria bacterium]|uniref:Uncharacterized protein n=1 Tax=Candidatus Dojkabacteria bacterium TaxID=2099670 RepID=A0A955I578_9BACT|nr:hypothetical protein [Candidatus Dojkabacteria bacterium]
MTEQIYAIKDGRDFELPPTDTLNQLAAEINRLAPWLDIPKRIENYLRKLESISTPEKQKALVTHAICSYLQVCIDQDAAYAAQFLFPPLDPRHELAPGEELLATEVFRTEHVSRNLLLAGQLTSDLFLSPQILFISGPMFSAKSGLASLIHGNLKKAVGEDKVKAVIFAGMGESVLHSRSLRNGDIAAEELFLPGFLEYTAQLIEEEKLTPHNANTRTVLFIEEATFFTAEEADAEKVANQMQLLREAGVSVVLIGLDKNYRTQDLAVTKALQQIPGIIQVSCASFQLNIGAEGQKTVMDAQSTSRHSTYLGMYDWLFPILIPREYAVGITYSPTPMQYHPMFVLQNHDPDLYNRISSLQEEELLQNHNALAVVES